MPPGPCVRTHEDYDRSTMQDLLTRTQFAERCGLTLGTIKRYRTLGILPEPDLYIDNKPLWKPATVDQWARGRG